jgi:hypothetical protein
MEKKPKNLGYFIISPKSKQSPNGPKFAKSGHSSKAKAATKKEENYGG